MPTYQYSCTDCGHFFEAVQSFADDSLTVCPVCEGRLRKVFNAVGVVFKGSGFYRNDSRAASGSGAGSSGEGAGSATKDGGSGSGSKDGGSKDGGASSTPSKDAGSSGGSSSSGSSTSQTKSA